MSRRIELVANLAIIAAALLFGFTTVKDRWSPNPLKPLAASAATEDRLKGTHLAMEGIKWDQADKTLVLALSTQCHFCQESVPFYRELTSLEAVKSKRIAIVAVFPQQLAEAQAFVESSKMRAAAVLSMPLQAIGTSATPTIFLVDRSGTIRKLWIGELSHTQQQDLLSELTKLS